jgi:hypothetical protein
MRNPHRYQVIAIVVFAIELRFAVGHLRCLLGHLTYWNTLTHVIMQRASDPRSIRLLFSIVIIIGQHYSTVMTSETTVAR